MVVGRVHKEAPAVGADIPGSGHIAAVRKIGYIEKSIQGRSPEASGAYFETCPDVLTIHGTPRSGDTAISLALPGICTQEPTCNW